MPPAARGTASPWFPGRAQKPADGEVSLTTILVTGYWLGYSSGPRMDQQNIVCMYHNIVYVRHKSDWFSRAMALPKFENIVMQETVPLKKLSDGRAAETKSPAGAPADVIGFGSRFSKI